MVEIAFLDNKHYRVMSRNATYIIVMKNQMSLEMVEVMAVVSCEVLELVG